MTPRIALRLVPSLVLVAAAVRSQESGKPPAPQQPPAAPQQPAQPTPTGLQFQVGDTTIKVGGYVKVDLIHDFDQINIKDSFDPRQIPTNDESDPGEATRMHAKSSRLNVDVRGPTSIGPGRAFVEGDFFPDDNNSSFRLRHAYATVEGWLFGQTWSTFMDEDAMPETLDFESPIAFPQIRQAMIRYTHNLDDQGNYFAFALEDPRSSIIAPPVPGDTEEPIPDITGRVRWKNEYGHVQMGLFAGAARFNPDAGSAENAFLWGLNLSSKFDLCKHDYGIVQLTYGPGVGRYRGGITAAPDASGNLEAVEVFGVMGALQHDWNEQWRSNVSYAWAKANLPGGVAATTTEPLSYLAANVIWQFCDKAWCGIEYLYGCNEPFDDHRGEANR